MWFRHAQNFVSDFSVTGGSIAKFFPVVEAAASDYVVDGGERPVGMVQMAMQHGNRIIAA